MSRTHVIVVRLAAIGLTLSLIAACSANTPNASEPPPVGLGHIHGIGENPSDKTVYIAAHMGVYRLKSGRPELIANRYQDTMGFTIVGPDDFLASGHPSLDSTDPNPLGLIRSTDLAESWTPIAFAGEQDFHAIDVVPGRTYAYGSSGELFVMQDQKTWRTVGRAELVDIAANPTAAGKVFATTTTGQLVTFGENANGAPSPASADTPRLALIDFTSEGAIVGVDPSGQVFVGDSQGDKLCAPIQTRSEVSCRNGNVVAINAVRWIKGADSYAGDIGRYRQYVVNHEVGHLWSRAPRMPGPGPQSPSHAATDPRTPRLRSEPMAMNRSAVSSRPIEEADYALSLSR